MAAILMDAFWLYPWLVFLGDWPALSELRPVLSLASLLLLPGSLYYGTRFLLNRKWQMGRTRLSIVAAALVACFLVLRLEYGAGFTIGSPTWFSTYAQVLLKSFSNPHSFVIAIPVCVYLSWRAVSLALSTIRPESVYRFFMAELASLVLLVIVRGLTLESNGKEGIASSTGIFIAGFFFCGLTALALANLSVIRTRYKTGPGSEAKTGRWLPVVFGVISGIVLVGVSIYSAFSSQILAFLGRVVSQLADWLYQLLYYVFYAVGFLVAGLYYVWQFIVNLFTGGKTPDFQQTMNGVAPEKLLEENGGGLPATALLAIKWTFFVLIASVLIFLLYRSVKRYRSARKADDVAEEDESLWSWSGFKADLKLFLSNIFKRFRSKQNGIQPHVVKPATTYSFDPKHLSIREIFRRLIAGAAYISVSRQRYETPNEFSYRLGRALPNGKGVVEELTSMYVHERYGDVTPDGKDVELANGLWAKMESIFSERNDR